MKELFQAENPGKHIIQKVEVNMGQKNSDQVWPKMFMGLSSVVRAVFK